MATYKPYVYDCGNKQQAIIEAFSNETEYILFSNVAYESLWVRGILHHLLIMYQTVIIC